MKTRTASALGLVLIAILAIALAACSSGGSGVGSSTPPATGGSTGGTTGGTTGAATVTEQNIAFSPATLSVKVGDVVTFKNADSVPHHVVVGTKDLGEQQPGQDVTWTADKAGTVPFKCIIHPSMTGQITVQ